jgi:tetratricopeptide (TPR) repeat protein
MNEFFALLDHTKGLYEAGLYDDVKIFCDLLTGMVESSNAGFVIDSKDKYMIYYLFGNAAFNLKEYKLAESLFNKALQINKSNLRPKPKTQSTLVKFFLKLTKNKNLIINFILKKDCETDIQIKYNLYLCLTYDKKHQEAFTIVILF